MIKTALLGNYMLQTARTTGRCNIGDPESVVLCRIAWSINKSSFVTTLSTEGTWGPLGGLHGGITV